MSIDGWRFIAAFLIVAIHISPFANISSEFDFFFTRILARIAVPLFIMITGYYLLDKSLEDSKRLKDYTKKILKIYLFCIILYLPINIYMGKFSNLNLMQIIKDLLINGTFYHLWYFPAIILGLWITYYLLKKFGFKYTFLITIILYLVGLLGDSYYGIVLMNNNLLSIYNNGIFKICNFTRNGLFLVPIFLCMGYMLKVSNWHSSLAKYLSLISFTFMTIEGMILHHYNFQRHDSMYIFLISLMYFLFSYLINKSKSSNKKLRSIATGIYIWHPFFIIVVRFFAKITGLTNILVDNNLILYIVVSMGTLVFIVFLERVKELLQNGRE